MKIMIQRMRASNGMQMPRFAYVKANWLERIALRRMMRAKRHNLRPARNWPGPAEFGASFILKAKGRHNVDPGRSPLPSKFVRIMSTPMFTMIDLLPLLCLSLVQISSQPWLTAVAWSSVGVTTLLSGVLYLARVKGMKR